MSYEYDSVFDSLDESYEFDHTFDTLNESMYEDTDLMSIFEQDCDDEYDELLEEDDMELDEYANPDTKGYADKAMMHYQKGKERWQKAKDYSDELQKKHGINVATLPNTHPMKQRYNKMVNSANWSERAESGAWANYNHAKVPIKDMGIKDRPSTARIAVIQNHRQYLKDHPGSRVSYTGADAADNIVKSDQGRGGSWRLVD